LDLQLYFRVLWRFRLLVAAGLILAVMLALLSYVRVNFEGGAPTFSYRESEEWQSEAALLVTEQGFPEGYRSPGIEVVPSQRKEVTPEGEVRPLVPRFAEADRFSRLAVLYASFVAADPVRRLMAKDGPVNGSAFGAIRAGREEGLLPIIDVTGISTTAQGALDVTARAEKALQDFIRIEQRENKVPPKQRVVLEQFQQTTPPELVQGRKVTRPVFLFVTVLIAVIGLAFVLENLRPRVRVVAREDSEDLEERSRVTSRRSA
jgi:hypothetical protein